MICRFCGEYVKDGASFCNHCGADLRDTSQAMWNTAQGTEPFAPQQPMPMLREYEVQTYKQSHKGIILLIAIIVMSVVAAVVIPTVIGYNSDIRRIKNGHIDAPGYEDKTWGDVMEDMCRDTEWKQFEENGNRMVKFTGKMKSDGDKLEIIFKMGEDRKTFTIESITDGDFKMVNEYAINIAVLKMFDGDYQ